VEKQIREAALLGFDGATSDVSNVFQDALVNIGKGPNAPIKTTPGRFNPL
jgi:hypothetical protein